MKGTLCFERPLFLGKSITMPDHRIDSRLNVCKAVIKHVVACDLTHGKPFEIKHFTYWIRPEHRDHVWSYDFVQARTHDGRAFRMLTVIDEFTRECLAIDVARRLTSEDVPERLSDLFIHRGVPEHIRSDNGAEFTATKVRE